MKCHKNLFLSQTVSKVTHSVTSTANRVGTYTDLKGNITPMLVMHTSKSDTIPLGMPLKVYPPMFQILMTCKPSTRLVLGYIFENLKRGEVEVFIPWQKFVQKKIGNKAAYYVGVKELIEKNFIQKKEGQSYFINHEYAFKGNRAKFLDSILNANN